MHIRYSSVYGSTRDYALVLGERLGVEPSDLSVPLPADQQGLIVLSPIHGPSVPGADIANAAVREGRPVALAGVGMTLPDVAKQKDGLRRHVDTSVRRFYLPGRLCFSTMDPKHKAVLASITQALKLKPRKNANERNMIAMFGKDTDWFDITALDPIIEWARA